MEKFSTCYLTRTPPGRDGSPSRPSNLILTPSAKISRTFWRKRPYLLFDPHHPTPGRDGSPSRPSNLILTASAKISRTFWRNVPTCYLIRKIQLQAMTDHQAVRRISI